MTKAFISWSGGKDAALSLYKVLQESSLSITSLPTNLNAELGRVMMHEVRRELLEAQAQAIGIPLKIVEMPDQPDMAEYQSALDGKLKELLSTGVRQDIFGDIFLEDLKEFREKEMAGYDIGCRFPLWGMSGSLVMKELMDKGFKAVTVCVDARKLPSSFCGRQIDDSFIRDLPQDVDPAGENGEYHSFVYDGPIFQHPVCFHRGDTVYKEYRGPGTSGPAGFYFCDLIPHT